MGGASGVFEGEAARAGWLGRRGGDERGGAKGGHTRHRRGGAARRAATFLPLEGLWI